MAAKLVLRKCPCLRPKIEEEVRVLDYRHSSLTDVPGDVFNFERTLEELYTDSNQIRDLPRELFYCHGLRKLSISDNEITNIPPAIASLDHLEELDFSKNGIIDVPDNIKCCKYLRVIDASVNPLGKLPEGFTQLNNLTHLYLNDTFLDYLPGSFGRLVKLKILEIRENHLKTLPKSFGRLVELERLDIGNNEFTDLPDVIGGLTRLLELWCDNNQITTITRSIGALKQLMFLDASKNQLETLPEEIDGCVCLADLHLSANQLQTLPDSLGNLNSLTTLKVDDNQLTSLPKTMGGLAALSELNISVNDLEQLPASIGLLRNLRTFYADENLLSFVPAELGSCSGITVLSLRSNKLTYIPDEIGRIPRLRVLNLSDNYLSYLPFTIIKLKELQALWLTENQTRPLIPLQSEYEPETGRKILTCYLLPQGHNSDNDENGGDGDNDSFHASIWDEERLQRQQIHFNFADDNDDEGHLVRCPTPYPKEMREKARHMKNLAMRQSMGDGAQASNWSPHAEHNHSLPPERKSSAAPGPGDTLIDVRVRDAHASKSQSSTLQETHRLYRCDKEKLIKDKARMQLRHSMPNIADELDAATTSCSPKRGKCGKYEPLVESEEDQESKVTDKDKSKKANSMKSEMEEGAAVEESNLCNGSRNSAGSDTEDHRVSGRRKSTPNLLHFEEPEKEVQRTPSLTYEDLYQKQFLHKHHHRGRRPRRMREYDSDTGYRSDHDMHSFYRQHAGDCKDDVSVRSQPTSSRSHRHRSRREGGYASDLEAYAGQGRGWSGGSNSLAVRSPMPKPSIYHLHPSHSLPQDLNDHAPPYNSQSRPQTLLNTSHSHQSPSSRQRSTVSSSPAQNRGTTLPEQRTPVTSPASQGLPSSAQSASGDHSNTKGSKDRDLQRELFTVLEERNKKSLTQDSRPCSTPSTSSSRGQNSLPNHHAAPHSHPDNSSESVGAQNSPRDSTKGFSNPEYTALQFASQERRRRTDSHGVGRAKDYETVAMVHQGKSVHFSSSAKQQRRAPHDSKEGPRTSQSHTWEGRASRQGHRVGRTEGYVEGTQTGDDESSDVRRRSGQDYSVSSHSSGSSSAPSYSVYNSQSSRTPDKSLSDHSHGNTSVISHPDTSAKHSSHRPDSSSQSRPRSGSRNTLVEDRSHSASHSPQKTFEGYPNPYGEPLEAGKPLMSSYEDVAVFKSVQDPSSQVSSSTDSGYGHSHHIYERIGDFSGKRSGSPRSSTPPSHQDTSLRHNSSSQGTPSRETTPVKEEGFYSVRGNMLSESTSQESRDVFRTVIQKNPGLGFSIAGGQGSRGINPFRAGDTGIFVTKVQPEGPAANIIQPGDKILQVNHINFRNVDHTTAVNVLKTSSTVELLIERLQKINMV